MQMHVALNSGLQGKLSAARCGAAETESWVVFLQHQIDHMSVCKSLASYLNTRSFCGMRPDNIPDCLASNAGTQCLSLARSAQASLL